MSEFVLAGEHFRDDRMFLLHIGPCTVTERDGFLLTELYHDDPPLVHKWCLVRYRNTDGLPADRVDHFETREEAQRYLEEVAPSVPLVSLGGRSPHPPKTYEQYRQWEYENRLHAYDPLTMYMPGGYNRTELITSRMASQSAE